MKFILRGGYNKRDYLSLANNVLFIWGPKLVDQLKNNKKVVVVTSAKPNNYYKGVIGPLVSLGAVEVNHSTSKCDWSKFDYILVLGGDNAPLINNLRELNFSLSNLKDDLVYIGDSAGAMVLGPVYYQYKHSPGPVFEKFLPGLGLLNCITIVHNNNPNYMSDDIRKNVRTYADMTGVEVVTLKENEEKVINLQTKP